MKKFDLRKKVMYTLSTGLLACTFSFAPLSAPAVAEAGGWDLLGTVLGTVSQATMEYEQVRTYLLNWGNSPETQQKTLDETVQKYGIDNSVEHNERVSRVLNQLIDKGHYAMEPNSLPFRWRVINNDEWNAACYPMMKLIPGSSMPRLLPSRGRTRPKGRLTNTASLMPKSSSKTS